MGQCYNIKRSRKDGWLYYMGSLCVSLKLPEAGEIILGLFI